MTSGVRNPNVVDLVTHDPKTDEYILIMVEDRPWSDSPEQLDQLLAKINTYVHFVEDGGLNQNFPLAQDKAVRIQLDCNSPPKGGPAKLIAQTQQLLLQRGITFAINVILYSAHTDA
jgi:hypothetical protein